MSQLDQPIRSEANYEGMQTIMPTRNLSGTDNVPKEEESQIKEEGFRGEDSSEVKFAMTDSAAVSGAADSNVSSRVMNSEPSWKSAQAASHTVYPSFMGSAAIGHTEVTTSDMNINTETEKSQQQLGAEIVSTHTGTYTQTVSSAGVTNQGAWPHLSTGGSMLQRSEISGAKFQLGLTSWTGQGTTLSGIGQGTTLSGIGHSTSGTGQGTFTSGTGQGAGQGSIASATGQGTMLSGIGQGTFSSGTAQGTFQFKGDQGNYTYIPSSEQATYTTATEHTTYNPAVTGENATGSMATVGYRDVQQETEVSRAPETRRMSTRVMDEGYSYVHNQSFATVKDYAGFGESRVASRLSSGVMSVPMTYPPNPDMTVICWPPRVPLMTQGHNVTNSEVERWKSNTAAANQTDSVQVIEVEVIQEVEVPRYVKKLEEKIIEKKVVKVVEVEKIVEVPEIKWVERRVDGPTIENWVERKKTVKIQRDIPKEVIVTKKVPQTVTKVVPREVIVKIPRPVPEPVPYHLKKLKINDIEKPTVVAQILKSTLRETEDVAEVALKEFVPELIPVFIQIPKPVSVQVWLGGIVSTVHRQTAVTAAHWNSLARIANAEISKTELMPYMHDVRTGFVPFLPATERIEWVTPLTDEWRSSGWSHVVVPDGYVLQSLELLVAEFNRTQEAEFQQAKLKLSQSSAWMQTTQMTQEQHVSAEHAAAEASASFFSSQRQQFNAPFATSSTYSSGLMAGAFTGSSLGTASREVVGGVLGGQVYEAGTSTNFHPPQSLNPSGTAKFSGLEFSGRSMNIKLSELVPEVSTPEQHRTDFPPP
eukprot:Gregarina_sp_Poly_1__9216@NODE_568_length_7500_cov_411_620611_g438_i1_p1_GENE_NODE_568_length_7500_cov_411_620611_g438_i1NODE_568_length_7500_cov_411_620611_g438_i1_p1_ORF_typecomplete_len816_score116_85E3_UFM1_ligase/PF09743_9/0_042_NODE_568_length_7500_cov_411_620611_g438_i125504997